MGKKQQRGFTLIEVIVVAAIIGILAGVLVPLIFKEIDEAKNARAAADVRSISNAILILRKDTGQWPVSTSCVPGTTLLYGGVTIPPLAGAGWDITNSVKFDARLGSDGANCWGSTWKGPYMATVNADPWGNAYVTNADAMLATGTPIWIMSAGPNGTIETASNAAQIDPATSDDIGLRIR